MYGNNILMFSRAPRHMILRLVSDDTRQEVSSTINRRLRNNRAFQEHEEELLDICFMHLFYNASNVVFLSQHFPSFFVVTYCIPKIFGSSIASLFLCRLCALKCQTPSVKVEYGVPAKRLALHKTSVSIINRCHCPVLG